MGRYEPGARLRRDVDQRRHLHDAGGGAAPSRPSGVMNSVGATAALPAHRCRHCRQRSVIDHAGVRVSRRISGQMSCARQRPPGACADLPSVDSRVDAGEMSRASASFFSTSRRSALFVNLSSTASPASPCRRRWGGAIRWADARGRETVAIEFLRSIRVARRWLAVADGDLLLSVAPVRASVSGSGRGFAPAGPVPARPPRGRRLLGFPSCWRQDAPAIFASGSKRSGPGPVLD